MADRVLDDYFSMESGEYTWFPREWAENADAAIALMPVVEKELYESLAVETADEPSESEEPDVEMEAIEVCARVGKKPNREPWLWVCKPTHPSARPYWQLRRLEVK